MRSSLASNASVMALGLVMGSACTTDGGGQPPRNRASGGSAGQAGAASGGAGTGGVGTGGVGTGGTAGIPSGGSAGSSGGNGGAAGGSAGASGGAGAPAWSCPAPPFEAPTVGGTATRVAGVPPPDSFNMNDGNFGNVEGPVWLGDALYVSEMSYMAYDQQNSNVKMARVLKLTSTGTVEIAIADSGSNGLAIDNQGNLLGAVHKDGSISTLSLSGGAAVPIVSMYMSQRFNSPNDLTVRSDGNIYFTDPDFQAPSSPMPMARRLYRVAPNSGAATAVEDLNNPNGVTLSPDQNTLYVAGGQLRKYPVMGDGSLGAGSDFLPGGGGGGDGMVVDCAGNLYVAGAEGAVMAVTVYNPAGAPLGTISVPEIQSATNVAFGGPERKTLYITGLGNDKGLFKIEMNVPGFPY